MPADTRYLTTNKWQKFAKISAAILGGYLISAGIHLALALWLSEHRVVLVTFKYSLYLLWVALMLIPFLFNNGWKCWLIYLAVIILCGIAILTGNALHPII